MGVITISRELGSEGDHIADLLCQQLDYDRVDKAILMQIAEEAGVDVDAVVAKERGFATRARLISGDMTSLYRKQPTAFERRADLDDQTYQQLVRKSLEQFAQKGGVIIVGRGGQMALKDWPAALHVHVYAAPEVRLERIKTRSDITAQEAQRRIAASDEQKRQYVRHMHNNANWKDPKHYHLMINTGYIALEVAAQIIMLAARQKASA